MQQMQNKIKNQALNLGGNKTAIKSYKTGVPIIESLVLVECTQGRSLTLYSKKLLPELVEANNY